MDAAAANNVAALILQKEYSKDRINIPDLIVDINASNTDTGDGTNKGLDKDATTPHINRKQMI